jgi:hypothetical protein
MVVDSYLVYAFVRRLVMPFDKYPAYTAGLIDADGNFLKSRDQFTPDEKKALPLFDIMIINLKRLIAKLPLGKTRLATIAAALMLLRAKPNKKKVNESLYSLEEDLIKTMKEVETVMEDGAAAAGVVNNAGGGGIAGLGDRPSVIVVPPKAATKYKKGNQKAANVIIGIVKRRTQI